MGQIGVVAVVAAGSGCGALLGIQDIDPPDGGSAGPDATGEGTAVADSPGMDAFDGAVADSRMPDAAPEAGTGFDAGADADATSGCNATSCAEGCCASNGACVGYASQSTARCGAAGAACSTCMTDVTGAVSVCTSIGFCGTTCVDLPCNLTYDFTDAGRVFVVPSGVILNTDP